MTQVTIFKDPGGQLRGATDEDERMYQQWRRKVRDLEHGEMLVFSWIDPRCPKHHAKLFAKIRDLFTRTEAFGSEKDLRQWLVQAAGYVDWQPGPDSTPNALPISIAFHELDEAEFSELHRAIDFVLWSSSGQEKLWPALNAEKRYRAMQDFMEAFE